MKLDHPALAILLQKAYSGEKAAAFAYIGHARSLRDPAAQAAVRQIELDEWKHRENVLQLMRRYEVPVSRWLELKLHIIGRVISASCHVIGLAPLLAVVNIATRFRQLQEREGFSAESGMGAH